MLSHHDGGTDDDADGGVADDDDADGINIKLSGKC